MTWLVFISAGLVAMFALACAVGRFIAWGEGFDAREAEILAREGELDDLRWILDAPARAADPSDWRTWQ